MKNNLSNLPFVHVPPCLFGLGEATFEGIMRLFLWSGSGEDKKLYLVKCSIMTQPMKRVV